jgi:hypothetical protein
MSRNRCGSGRAARGRIGCGLARRATRERSWMHLCISPGDSQAHFGTRRSSSGCICTRGGPVYQVLFASRQKFVFASCTYLAIGGIGVMEPRAWLCSRLSSYIIGSCSLQCLVHHAGNMKSRKPEIDGTVEVPGADRPLGTGRETSNFQYPTLCACVPVPGRLQCAGTP